jgi:antitoxin component of RelBE/YafQ-DinJ toxin-antitoxin module
MAKSESVRFRLDAAEQKMLDQLAAEDGLCRSAILRMLIHAEARRRKEKREKCR